MKTTHRVLVALASLAFTAQASAAPQVAVPPPAPDEPAPYSEKLLGDFGGVRSKIADKGLDVSLDYAGDVWGVVDGGKKRTGTYLDLIKLTASIDGEKMFGIKGNTVKVSLLDSDGNTTNAGTVGSTQGIDNNEVPSNGVRLFEAWVQQNFLDDRLSVLVGLHDLNSEFDETDMSANFLKPTMQIGQSFAQSGKSGPSIFPTSAFTGRVRFKPTESSYVAVAAYDGVPGDPDRTTGSAVRFAHKDGLLLVGEVGVTPKVEDADGNPNKFAVGVWQYTGGLDDLTDLDGSGNPAKSTAEGVYALSSYQFYHDKAKRTAGVFLRGGLADGDTAQVDWDYELGLVGGGWIPTRGDGEFGLGLSQAHNSDKYMKAQALAATPSDRNEYSYELYYRDTIARGISVQPDVQYVVNPGTDTVTEDATIIGMRLGVSF